ncbi:MAG: Gfo/Idh/MocA family oxidoreductase, partial [Candidatus Nanopelagicales bacterium]
ALAEQALHAGRHVLLEKPFATTQADALSLEQAATAAARDGTVLVVDHVLRYNPLLQLLDDLSNIAGFGPVQRVAIENDASDEDLRPDHWFWDRDVSGGIFVEHGVHFFAACDALVGEEPSTVQAIELRRDHAGLVDRALATLIYPSGTVATHLHAFTHARRCERQWWRIDLGTAQVVVEGWIPIRLTLEGWTDDLGVEALDAALDSPVPSSMEVERDADGATARAGGVERLVPHRVRLTANLGGPAAKTSAYQASVRAALIDLQDCVRTGRTPTASAAEGLSTITTALAAREAAHTGRTIPIGKGQPS